MRVIYKPEDQKVIDMYQEEIEYCTSYLIKSLLKSKQNYSITTDDWEKINKAVLNDHCINKLKSKLSQFIMTRVETRWVLWTS